MAVITLNEINFRVYIGPYHLHYDWSGLNLGTSFSLGSATLYNDLGVETSYTNAVAYEPTWDSASGGQVFGVTWVIDRIR